MKDLTKTLREEADFWHGMDPHRAELFSSAASEIEHLRAIVNQCRLAFAGHVSARSAIDMIDTKGDD